MNLRNVNMQINNTLSVRWGIRDCFSRGPREYAVTYWVPGSKVLVILVGIELPVMTSRKWLGDCFFGGLGTVFRVPSKKAPILSPPL